MRLARCRDAENHGANRDWRKRNLQGVYCLDQVNLLFGLQTGEAARMVVFLLGRQGMKKPAGGTRRAVGGGKNFSSCRGP